MTQKDLIIVANKFSEFAAHCGAVTPDQVIALIDLPKSMLPQRLVLHRGQGVADSEIDAILSRIRDSDPEGDMWDTTPLTLNAKRAGGHHSHKRHDHNTLITEPHQTGADSYRMHLLVDEGCELMGDHQTGQHIQGMVLIEAARQAFLVVTEQFFLSDRNQKSYFVINSVGTKFENFVFPVSAHLDYRVISKDINERRQKFEVEVDVVQSGMRCMTSSFSFTVYPASLIAQKERALAESAVAGIFKTAVPISPAAQVV